MEIKQDKFCIERYGYSKFLIEKGYAHPEIHSFRFSIENNIGCGINYTLDEMTASMQTLMAHIASRLVCYHYDQENMRMDSPEWDLYFWCKTFLDSLNGHSIGDMDMRYFTLTTNELHDHERVESIYNIVMDVLKEHENMDGLTVTIVYKPIYDENRIANDAAKIVGSLVGKRVKFRGMDGKVIEVPGGGYGFMKVRARNRYYAITDQDILWIGRIA